MTHDCEIIDGKKFTAIRGTNMPKQDIEKTLKKGCRIINWRKSLMIFLPLFLIIISSPASATWANASYAYKQNWNFTNGLAFARTNASVVFNISTTHTRADCKDIVFYNCTEDGMFTNYNIINNASNCTVRLYDNWTSTGMNCYWAYFDGASMDNSGFWNNASYELTWLYNASLGVSQFNQTECTSACGISTKTVDGQTAITFKDGTSVSYYNISDWFTQNGGNIGDNYVLIANISKESGGTIEYNFGDMFLEMSGNAQNFYDILPFTNPSNQSYMRNRTSGTYGSMVTTLPTKLQMNTYYYRQANISNGNVCHQFTNATGTFSHCYQFSNPLTGYPAGIGGYASSTGWNSNLTAKDMKGGTYMTNRNMTSATGSEIASGSSTENYLTLNNPLNGGTITTYAYGFNYTPVLLNGAFRNCTLRGNFTGSFLNNASNSTAITNNSINTISITMIDGTYKWDVICYNSTTEYFTSSSNFTVTVAVPTILLWTVYAPAVDSVFYYNNNFTYNGSVNCTQGNCGDIKIYPRYSSESIANSFTDDTNDEFYQGSFGNAPNQMTMNLSNTLVLFPDLTKIRKSASNPVMIPNTSSASNYDYNGVLVNDFWYNSSNGYYYAFLQVRNTTADSGWRIATANSSDLITWNKYNNNNAIISPNASNAWENLFVADSSTIYNPSKNMLEKWYIGCQNGGVCSIGYANSTNATTWTIFNSGNPILNSTYVCGNAGDNIFNMKVWIENGTYFATVLCDGNGAGLNYNIRLMNSSNGMSWQTMNGGNYVMYANDISCQEIQNNGILSMKYNSTNNVYLQLTGFTLGKGYGSGGAEVLAYSFDKINWYYWNSGQVVLDVGSAGSFDYYRISVNDWFALVDGNVYILYNGLGTSGSSAPWKVGLATANLTSGYYMSSVKNGGSNSAIWNTLSWENTTCNECSVKGQIGVSNDSTTWSWSSNYTTNTTSVIMVGMYAKYRIYLTGNNTHSPAITSVTIGNSNIGTVDMNDTTYFRTSVPYSCGVLNQTNQNCTWNFSINSTQIGTYNISFKANSSATSNTSTGTLIYVFSLPNASLTLSNNLSWAGTYNTTSATTGGGCTAGLTCNLFRNGASVSNPDNAILGAGTWIYIYNTTGNANYSPTTINNTLVISKGTSPLSITFNVSNPTSTSTPVSASCSYPAEITASFFFSDGGIVSNPYNFTTGGIGSVYNFTCNTTGNTNYSASSANASLGVNVLGALSIDGVYDENNISKVITFDVELFNATYSNKTTNITSYFNNIVTGLVTIRISSAESNSAGFCSGTALNCTNFSTEYSCYYQQGCHWLGNSTNGNCSQNPTPCSAFLSSSICYQQSGCAWTDTTLSSYGTRYYFMEIPANSGTHNLTAYLVNSSAGHTVSFTIYNRNENPIENANITISRLLPTWKVVGARFTDSAGAATFFADNSANYKIYVTKSGYDDKEVSLPLTESSYRIYLTGIGYTGNYTSGIWENISYYVSPSGGVLQNGTQIFNFTINSTDSKLEYWGMNVTHGNGTVLCSLNYTTAFGGTAACSLNLSNESGKNVTITTWFKKTGFALWTDPIFEKIQSWQNSGLYKILSDLGALEPVALGVFAIIIAIMVAGVGTTSLPYGTKVGSGVIMLAVFAILIYGVESINGVGYLWSWGIWIVTAISIGAYYYLKGGW